MLINILLSLTLVFNLAVTSQKPAGSKPDFTETWNARIFQADHETVSAM